MSATLLSMICPACKEGNGRLLQRLPIELSARHFVPERRDQARHQALLGYLRRLWDDEDHVEFHICEMCSFGFVVPWVGADAEFYELLHEGNPHYPADRWEFGETLAHKSFSHRLRIAEIGSGDGAFLDRVRALPNGDQHQIVAADFDIGAIQRLRSKGYEAVQGSLEDLNVGLHNEKLFDVICMFQTFQSMADIDAVFAQFSRLLVPGGSVFLSMPLAEAATVQEQLTGLWYMPPLQVARWNPVAISTAVSRRGFQVVDIRRQPMNTLGIAWQLSIYSVEGAAYRPGTLAERLGRIHSRPIRGGLKRVLAALRTPWILAKRANFQPLSMWVHIAAP